MESKTERAKPRVAVVGVGRMGANIALRLKDRGYAIAAVYDTRDDAAVRSSKETGAKRARTLAEIAPLADVILTVVTDDAAMDAIFSESGDSLLSGAEGKIFVNTARSSGARTRAAPRRSKRVWRVRSRRRATVRFT